MLVKAGTEIRNEAGELIVTTTKDFTIGAGQSYPSVSCFILPNAEVPVAGTTMPKGIEAALFKAEGCG
jgi:hypothetical protein